MFQVTLWESVILAAGHAIHRRYLHKLEVCRSNNLPLPELPSSSKIAAVIAGSAAGAALIVTLSYTMQSVPLQSDDLIRAGAKMEEAKAFLRKYPDTNATMYSKNAGCNSCPPQTQPPIVEYSHKEGQGARYADLRIEMTPENGKATFFQIRCLTIGDEAGSYEIHGPRIDNITQFLQDGRCP